MLAACTTIPSYLLEHVCLHFEKEPWIVDEATISYTQVQVVCPVLPRNCASFVLEYTHIDGSCSQSQVGRHTKCHCTRPRCCRRRLVREPPGRLNFQTTDHNISKDTASMILTMNALRKHSDTYHSKHHCPVQDSLSWWDLTSFLERQLMARIRACRLENGSNCNFASFASSCKIQKKHQFRKFSIILPFTCFLLISAIVLSALL